MGLLIDGVWQAQEPDDKESGGRFERQEAAFRSWITSDGSQGPSGEGGFKAEAGRYHLYVALACPWAHRTLVFRSLKGLREMIDVTTVSPDMLENGWEFEEPEPLFGSTKLHQIYTKAKPDYSGRVTVPVLWDKERGTIVSNESSEIIRMFNSAFDRIGARADLDFYPPELREEIDEVNALVYENVNNGVYKCGFASTQDAYEEAFHALFETLDTLDERLGDQRYLVGDRLTEADWRLFTTLVRFDAVYVGHFKCNLRRIRDYANLSNYLRDLYQVPGVKRTVDMAQIKRHYYYSHETVNPKRIVPVGPLLFLDAPHDRDRFPAEGRPEAA